MKLSKALACLALLVATLGLCGCAGESASTPADAGAAGAAEGSGTQSGGAAAAPAEGSAKK